MDATTVAVDLAKNVFQLAVADRNWHIVRTLRLSRAQFERWFDNTSVDTVIMEACGSAHHWGRVLQERGIQVKLLPASYVRAYVKRNKTDAADAAAQLTATAMVAATSGSVSHFTSARHFAAWFGLTPKEHSSGSSRRLGRITKRGDRYLRMLLTHGARSVLNAARLSQRRGRALDPLRAWALGIPQRSHHNKATCALANKLARICYGVLRDAEPYMPGRLAAPVDLAA